MSKRDVQAHVDATREQLSATLGEVEHRLSPAEIGKSAASWISASYDRSPGRWLVSGGVALVTAVAAVLWAVFTKDD